MDCPGHPPTGALVPSRLPVGPRQLGIRGGDPWRSRGIVGDGAIQRRFGGGVCVLVQERQAFCEVQHAVPDALGMVQLHPCEDLLPLLPFDQCVEFGLEVLPSPATGDGEKRRNGPHCDRHADGSGPEHYWVPSA